jgi:tetratricopeptide (TPR) repeat protein
MTTANTGGSLIGRIGSYLQIVAKDPSSTAFVPLAEAYRQVGLLDDALEAARLGTKMLPHFSPGFSTLGRILGQMGRIDEAMSAYARALSLDRQSQAALVGLARIHLIRGERDQARKILKEAVEFHPDDEKVTDMLNALDLPRPWDKIKQAPQVQEPQGQQPSAIENSLAEAPAEPIPTATLAEIYVKQGLLEKATKIYQEILDQDPGNESVRERILQLQIPDEQAESADGLAGHVEQVAAQADVDAEPVQQEEQKDQSPIAIMQRWLNAIKQGRANV